MTVVVPSPTSSSCVRLSSIMLLAAGCATSISRSIACPSFVRTIPPMGSSSILSIAFGPRHDLMISATLWRVSLHYAGLDTRLWAYVFAAVIFDSWALRPTCLSPDCVSWRAVSPSYSLNRYPCACGHLLTHHHHWGLHLCGFSLWLFVGRISRFPCAGKDSSKGTTFLRNIHKTRSKLWEL